MVVANILFDLDGTLTDSRDGIVACLRYALVELGCDCPSDAELVDQIGVPLKECFPVLMGCTEAVRVDAAIALYRERFAAQGMFENTLYPAVPTVLQRLRDLGATLFVTTSKPRVFAERIVQHFQLEPHFHAVYGSELDGTRSNKAALIQHVLDVESLSPASTYMVGDRAQDIIGARSNGVFAIGALWGYGSRAELVEAEASMLCEEPAMLVRQLSSILHLSRTLARS